MKDFREFLLRGNLVDMAVGIVIGIAFAAVVTALVADLVTPLIAAIGGKPDFSSSQLHDQQEPLPLRRLHQRADHVRRDRRGHLLPRREARQRADGAAQDGASGRRDHEGVPALPEPDPGRGAALRVLHAGGRRDRLTETRCLRRAA